MKANRLSPMGANAFQVQVRSNENGVLKGVVSSLTMDRPVEFSGLSRLVLLIDNLLDLETDGVPKAPEPPVQIKKPLAVLELEILFRQNYSWQGKLRWMDRGQEATFRSVLELLIILETLFEEE